MAGRNAAASFDPLRPKLTRIAYRMLGSVADAEDVVQDAFLRWLDTDRAAVREPEAFLRRVVTRLALDQLKSAGAGARPISGLGCRSRSSRRRVSRSMMSRYP
jgi:RNA polymerase sigma-70 factor (ECF subfamily)